MKHAIIIPEPNGAEFNPDVGDAIVWSRQQLFLSA